MSDQLSLRRPSALVIEDETDILQLLSRHLLRLGYRVATAQTGEHGMALAFIDPPDVVLVDVILPGMDGREVIRRLRADERTRRCAILVCSVLEPTELAGIDADKVLSKPFSKSTLTRVLNDITR